MEEDNFTIKICPRCAQTATCEAEKDSFCSFCEEPMLDTGTSEDEWAMKAIKGGNTLIVWETLQLEKIKSNPKFSQALYEKRLEIEKAEHDEGVRKALEARKGLATTVSCPYCHSTNVKKVGTSGRVLSILTLGLASGKVGKQWHCRSCGSDF